MDGDDSMFFWCEPVSDIRITKTLIVSSFQITTAAAACAPVPQIRWLTRGMRYTNHPSRLAMCLRRSLQIPVCRVPFCFHRVLSPRFYAPMSLQRLYDLDGLFPERLDELLRDNKYVEELRQLPDPELSELLDHLDEASNLFLHDSCSSDRYFTDPSPSRSYRGFIQKVPSSVAQDMQYSEGSPYDLRVVQEPFAS